jgi:hypothetical protein
MSDPQTARQLDALLEVRSEETLQTGTTRSAAPEATSGWDPYEVWRSRVFVPAAAGSPRGKR